MYDISDTEEKRKKTVETMRSCKREVMIAYVFQNSVETWKCSGNCFSPLRKFIETSLVVQELSLCTPNAQVQSLVRELRFLMLPGTAKINKYLITFKK